MTGYQKYLVFMTILVSAGWALAILGDKPLNAIAFVLLGSFYLLVDLLHRKVQ